MYSFAAIAAAADPSRLHPFELRHCPDVLVLQAADLLLPDGEGRRRPAADRPDGSCLILVLESPHKNEFAGEPSPAKGKTGQLIVKRLPEVAGLESAARLPLLLINAVQHQCSLGEPTVRFRDAVFSACWDQGGKQHFMERLQAVYRPGDTVACCCTKGTAQPANAQIRQRVWEAMRLVVPEERILRRNHPSSWGVTLNRQFEWPMA